MKKISIGLFFFLLHFNSFSNGVIKCIDENKKIVYSTYQDIAKSKQKLKCENAKLGALSVYSKGGESQKKSYIPMVSDNIVSKKIERKTEQDNLNTIDAALAMTNDPEEKKILEELKQSHLQNNQKNKTDVNLIVPPDIKDMKGKLPISMPQ